MDTTTGAIILAAGNSKRMGQCKFLLPMSNGKSFYENLVRTFLDHGIKNLVVVTQARYLMVLEDLSLQFETQPKFVVNKYPEYERFYSLQLGIKALGNADYSFVHNADSPFVDLASLDLLELNKQKADYVCPVFNHKGGHPILINKKTMKHMLNSPMTAVLRDELATKTRLSVQVSNPFIAVDIDTPEDYKTYIQQHLAQPI